MNYWAVLVAAAASYALGWMWHGPLFGKKWMELEGMNQEEMLKSPRMKYMKLIMAGGFVNTLILAWGLAYVLSASGVLFNTPIAIGLVVVIWLAFLVTNLAGGWLWEGKSTKAFAFSVVYPLVSIVLMTLILTKW